MKNMSITILALCFMHYTFAQTTLKLYATFPSTRQSALPNSYVTVLENSTPTMLKTITPYSIAVNKKLAKNKYIEIEIGQIRTSQKKYNNAVIIIGDSIKKISYQYNIQSIACRLEYGRQIANSADKKWNVVLGQSLQPSYAHTTSTPISSNTYYIANTQIDVAYHVIPHIQFMGKKRFGVDVNFPVYIFNIGSLSSNIDNPNLPEKQRRWTTLNFDALNANKLLAMRIGLVYQL
jgi:hypothetical protein